MSPCLEPDIEKELQKWLAQPKAKLLKEGLQMETRRKRAGSEHFIIMNA